MIELKYIKKNCLLMGLVTTTLLAACNNAPQPNTVSGYSRSPINDTKTTENFTINAEVTQTAQPIVAEKQLPKIPLPKVVLIQFDYNSTVFTLPEDEQISLIHSALQASRIDIRGRTDGKQPTQGNEKIAQGRAMAVRNYLVTNGVSPQNINLNFLAVGDNIANNHTNEGQAVNRRAEVEISFN